MLDARGMVKPRGRLVINRDHPLVDKDLILALVPGEGDSLARDLSPQRQVWTKPASSNLPPQTTQGVPAWDFRGGVKELRFAHRASQPFIADRTAAFSCFVYWFATGSGQFWSIGQQTDANDVEGFGQSTAANNPLCIYDIDAATATSTLNPPVNKWNTGAVTQTGASARTFILNGVAQANSTTITASAIGATQPQSIGRAYSNSVVDATADFTGLIGAIYVWKAAKNVQLLQALCTNPYALVTAQPTGLTYSYATPAAAPTGVVWGWQPTYPDRPPDPVTMIPF